MHQCSRQKSIHVVLHHRCKSKQQPSFHCDGVGMVILARPTSCTQQCLRSKNSKFPRNKAAATTRRTCSTDCRVLSYWMAPSLTCGSIHSIVYWKSPNVSSPSSSSSNNSWFTTMSLSSPFISLRLNQVRLVRGNLSLLVLGMVRHTREMASLLEIRRHVKPAQQSISTVQGPMVS